MVYQLPHVPISLISFIDPLPDLFLEESPTSIYEHPPLISEFPPSIYDVSSHSSDEPPAPIIDVPTDTASGVDPTGPSDSHALRRSHWKLLFLFTFVTSIAFLLLPLSRNLELFVRLPLTFYGSKL